MTTLHNYLIRTLSVYHNWHQTKHHNKIHWGVLAIFTLLVFGMISRWTPISLAADTAAPTTPTNLTATPISSSQINLSWTASTDDVGVAGYKIYRCAGSSCAPTTQITTSAVNSYSNTGLTASTAYTYTVSAYDATGNESGKSSLASATTQAQLGNVYYACDVGTTCGVGWNTGSDTNVCTSKTMPCKTIKAGVSKLKAGDTLIIGDGTYTGLDNMLSNSSGWGWELMPSGTPDNYITIKAEHYLGAVLDGQESYNPIHITNGASYLIFDGLYAKHSSTNGGGANVRAQGSHHLKFLRMGSEEGGHAHFWFRYSSYILVEDSFAFGRGTYYFAFVGSYSNYADSQYNVCRRCVARLDYHHYAVGGNWFAPFVSYWSDNTHFQNSISIDGIENPPGDSQAVIKGFYIANGGSNYSAEGSIILNEDGRSAYFESGSPNVTLKNNVMWGKVAGYIKCCTGGANAVFDNNTMGMISGTGEYDFGIYGDGNLSSVKNNLFYGIKRYALTNVQNNAYNSFYLNGGNYWYGASGGIGEITNVDPLVSGLKYLPRIEDGSFLKTAGENGSQIGTQIMKRIGVSGTLYGEPGWNTLTNEDLWPFPNEGKIKEKMSAYNLHGVNGARGFAVAGTGLYGGPITLTSYIWEYLGNPCPAGICVAIPDITAPTTPTNLTATPISSSQINLSWTASTDDVGVTGYKIYRCAGSACTPTVQIATSAVNSYSNTGLTASTAYTYAVSAYDAAGNESEKSVSASATMPSGLAANFPLEITNIKPAGTGSPAITATNRIFRAYPGIEYNIRPAVIGGLYPFTYSLSNAPAGMIINVSTGEITWPNPQADSGTITLSVTDAENTTVKTTWAITVTTSGFLFVNSSYAGTQTGSITQPYSSIANLLAAQGSVADITYFREGTYPIPGTGELSLTGKSSNWLGYPVETATITGATGAYLRSGGAIYFDNLNFRDFSNSGIMVWGGHHYQTIRRTSWSNIVATSSINNNYGFIYATSAEATPGFYFVIQDSDFSNFTGASAIGSLYDTQKMLIEDNYIHNSGGGGVSGINNGISAKYRTSRLTVRGNRVIMTDGFAFGRGSMNGPMIGTSGVDVSFNFFVNQSGSIVNNFNGGSWSTADSLKNFFFYRNTVMGKIAFELLDGINCGANSQGPFNLNNNVIINSNTSSPGNYFTHDYISYGSSNSSESTSPWNCITDMNNLKGTASQNIVDSSGNLTSGYSQYIGTRGWQIGVTDTEFPATPTNLSATSISSSQINLSWTASTDDVGVTGYKIYRCAGSGCTPTTQIATSATNFYSNTGLTASTAYTYAISAYDAAGNESGKSASVSVTTFSQFKQADFNKDGVVNQLDFDILKQDWNRTDKPVSDLNQDGVVDSRDLGIMMSEWTR